MKTPDLHKIDQAMKSLDGIKRAEVNPFLMTRILEKMKTPIVQRIKPVLVRNWVMSLVLVLAINIGAFFYLFSPKEANERVIENSTYVTTQLYTY